MEKPIGISDQFWQRVQPLLPSLRVHPQGGRPPLDDRQILVALLYVLRTKCPW